MVSTATPLHDDEPKAKPRPAGGPRGTIAIPMATCMLVALLAQLPVLRDRWAYFTDDAATQILPMWFRLGERVLAGEWPPLLELDAWMGGNLAVETLFGIWNPVNAGIWVLVASLPDLAVAGTAVRTLALVALAFGCYLLCREYGATPWSSSVLAVAIPFCGPLFYFDTIKWPAAMLAFTYIPYLWWAARRMAHDRMNAFWVFAIGALAVTSGSPYGMLGVCVVLAAVLGETLLRSQLRSAGRLLLVSTTIAALVPLVYFPLLLSKHVTWRTDTPLGNSGVMAPGLGDLVNLSFPNYIPEITGLGDPAVFFCWFALPLAAWLDWGVLRTRARELSACLLVAGVFFLLAIGPAEIWMFRWPLRVLHYAYLPAAVLLAVLLSAGLRKDHARRRTLATGVLLSLSFYLGWAAAPYPESTLRNLVSLLIIGALTAIVLLACRSERSLALTLHLGTIVAFTLQVGWFLAAANQVSYYFPTSVAQARANFEGRYVGQTMQVADTGLLGPPDQQREAWRDLAFGNLHLPAGVHSINSYTSMGYGPFSDQLCFSYHGSTCPDAYAALWKHPPGIDVPLADLLRLDTVVVHRQLVEDFRIPRGWRVQERNDRVTVLQRQEPASRPGGRLSWSSTGVRVTSNAAPDDRHEVLRFERSGGQGRLVFARLAWPGYIAKVDGVRVPASSGPAGLLEVQLPPGVDRGELRITWAPPRYKASLAVAATGLLGAVALGTTQIIGAARSRQREVS